MKLGAQVLKGMFAEQTNRTLHRERILPCNQCGPDKRHAVVETYRFAREEKAKGDFTWFRYEICRCSGCGAVVFREAWSSYLTQVWDPITGKTTLPSHVTLWHTRPPLLQGLDPETLPTSLRSAYQQTKAALRDGQHILASFGLRALLEAICKQRKAEGGNLYKKIEALAGTGGTFEPKTLHKIRFLGNDAAHRLDEPRAEELEVATQIIENLLSALYVLPKRARKTIRRRDPPRKKPPKK